MQLPLTVLSNATHSAQWCKVYCIMKYAKFKVVYLIHCCYKNKWRRKTTLPRFLLSLHHCAPLCSIACEWIDWQTGSCHLAVILLWWCPEPGEKATAPIGGSQAWTRDRERRSWANDNTICTRWGGICVLVFVARCSLFALISVAIVPGWRIPYYPWTAFAVAAAGKRGNAKTIETWRGTTPATTTTTKPQRKCGSPAPSPSPTLSFSKQTSLRTIINNIKRRRL